MILDATAPNPAFPDGRAPDADLDELVSYARSRLQLDRTRPWRLISARRKLSKVLFEIEEERSGTPVRYIAKVSADERIRVTFEALSALWNVGFRPPSRYTVVEPLAYFPERDLVIQERAPGVELIDKVQARGPGVLPLVRDTATWLARLHAAEVPCQPWTEPTWKVEQWSRDLQSVAGPEAARIARLEPLIISAVHAAPQAPIVPCHGDFHLMNMFVAEDGRLTGIDVDKFGGRTRSEEVAYFLAQALSICFHRLGSFSASRELRTAFLDQYTGDSGVELSPGILGPYMAATLIKNLHFDLFTYKSGRTHILPGWLDAAECCLAGSIDIA